MGISMEKFEIERADGKVLRGFEIKPKGKKNLPIVVVSHGFMANFITTIGYAIQFANLGYCAYCYDFIGGGFGIRSDGKLKDMTVFTEVGDLKMVVEYVRSRSYNNADDLTLMGCSQGGCVSALTAAELGADIVKKLVLFYPALCIPDDSNGGKMVFFKFNPKNVPKTIGIGPMTVCREYVTSMQEFDLYGAISKYKGKVFIAHGDKDGIVPYEYSVKAYETYKSVGTEVSMMRVPGAGHMFMGIPDMDAFFAVKKFLEDKLLIMDVDVKLTGAELLNFWGPVFKMKMPFIGNSITNYYKGDILPGAADVQHYFICLPFRMRAEYTFAGKDFTGADCKVHVVNRFNVEKGFAWHPVVDTDSKALDFLNGAKCDASFRIKLNPKSFGPRIRIYTKVKTGEQK